MALNDLALSWKDHHSVIISVFEKLLEKEALVDCTLAADGKFLKAHKVVLSACSPYLEDLLNQESDKHPIIFLRDVQFDDLKTLVQFVYSGEIKIPEDRLVEFLNIAEALQIKGLGGGQNEAFEKKEVSQHRDSPTPVHRKRPRLNSDGSDSSDKNETSTCDSVRQRKGVKHGKETKLKTSNVGSTASSCEAKSNTEVLNQEIPKVKEEVIEVIDPVPAVSHPPSARQTSDPVPNDSNEGLDEVKPEFEQVTFTEDYSDELLLEENDGVKSVINPDEPSTSHQYSGYSSESFDTGGLVEQSSTVANATQPPPEGLNLMVHQWLSSPVGNVANERAECRRDPVDRGAEFNNTDCSLTDGPQLKMDQYSLNPKKPIKTKDLRAQTLLRSEKRIYNCTYCSARFRRSENLMSHLCLHEEDREFPCTNIPARFEKPKNLKSHLLTHSGERPFTCTFCSASFNRPSNLKNHLRTHTGEKPYECTHCSKRFNLSCNLRRHLSIHFDQKPFRCSYCSNSYSQRAHLIAHLCAHTGEKPYQCTVCKKAFSRKDYLKVHLLSHDRS